MLYQAIELKKDMEKCGMDIVSSENLKVHEHMSKYLGKSFILVSYRKKQFFS